MITKLIVFGVILIAIAITMEKGIAGGARILRGGFYIFWDTLLYLKGYEGRLKMMTVSVRETFSGTLCTGCAHSIMMESRSRKVITYCHIFEERVPPVERCSAFSAKGSQSVYDLEQIAWIIDKGPMKSVGFNGKVKFVKPGDEKHRDLQDLPSTPRLERDSNL